MTVRNIVADGSSYSETSLGDGLPVVQSITYSNPVHAMTLEEQRALERSFVKDRGNHAWKLLHSYLGCDRQWLDLWVHFIPAGSCNCKEGYRKILESFAWDFTSPKKFFESGVELHNLVNQKLIDQGDTTKKIVTLDEAYSIWRNGDGSDENK
jgi:hypothetical protein